MSAQSNDYFSYHYKLLNDFAASLPVALKEVLQESQQQELMDGLKLVQESLKNDPVDGFYPGQLWFFSFISNHPQFTPLVPRSLLWFLGGDCLHFLTEEEITGFQTMEENVQIGEITWHDLGAYLQKKREQEKP